VESIGLPKPEMSFRRLTKSMFFDNPSLSRLPRALSPNSSRLDQSFSVSVVRRTSRRPLDTPAHSHTLKPPSPPALRLLTFNLRPLTVPFSKRRRINTYNFAPLSTLECALTKKWGGGLCLLCGEARRAEQRSPVRKHWERSCETNQAQGPDARRFCVRWGGSPGQGRHNIRNRGAT